MYSCQFSPPSSDNGRTKGLDRPAQRDTIWSVHPYPCIGQFRFLEFSISSNPAYTSVLFHLRLALIPPPALLDLGCCLGQDLRRLVFDGVPSDRLVGVDVHPEFFEQGYKLFRDRETLQAKFITADVLDDSPENPLGKLQKSVDMVHAASFLHLWGWDMQVKLCERILSLLHDRPGSMVFGRQVGNVKAGEYPNATAKGKVMWRHDAETFRRMWEIVGSKTGTKWRVKAELTALDRNNGGGDRGWQADGTGVLRF
jgi:SAM-dependent methyltransferase